MIFFLLLLVLSYNCSTNGVPKCEKTKSHHDIMTAFCS